MMKRFFSCVIAVATLVLPLITPTIAFAADSKVDYSATLLLASESQITVEPGASFTYRLGYKNTGTRSWGDRAVQVISSAGLFSAPSWQSSTIAARVSGTPLESGRLELYDILLVAPATSGVYQLNFSIIADGAPVSNSESSITVRVGASSDTVLLPNSEQAALPPVEQLPPEPMIRVGLGKVEGAVSFRVGYGSYTINLLDGTPITWLAEGDKSVIEFDPTANLYLLNIDGKLTTSTIPFRFLADSSESRFLLIDKAETAKWNNKIVYNEYRGTFELRFSERKPAVWMINELPIEQYLRGLIETGNSEPMELHKAVYTAARSYAYTYLPDGVRAPDRLYDVHATLDQYYKGYSAEKANPNGMKALDETRGLVVTYDGKPVITPYFTRSNGKTKTWKSVWGGADKPWLKPVVAKYDVGKKMLGHGVGMSNQDAKARILKDKWTFDQVLGYYYSDTSLKKMYE